MFRRMWKNALIKRKLIVINLLTTGVALILAGSALMLEVYFSFRNSLINNLSAQAKVLASSSTATLVFNDQKQAAEDLRALRASPNITCAIIFDKKRKVFAEYRRDGAKKVASPIPRRFEGYLFTSDHLHLFHAIELDRERVGTIYLRSDLKQLHSLMLQYGVITVLTMWIVFIGALLLLTKLQRSLTGPIFSLARSMRTVSTDRNYAHRTEVLNEDEIGFLAEGFNDMLDQIQDRDLKLRTEIEERKLAAEELRKANSRIARLLKFSEALLSAIPTPVFYKDVEGRYLGCNNAFSEITGVSADQIRGRTAAELWPAENAEEYEKKDLELLRNPAKQVHEFRMLDKCGADRTVIFVKDVFLDENGHVAGIVGAFLDITERKQSEDRLRQAKEEWDRTFDAIVDPIMIVDANHMITKANRAMVDKLGFSPAEAEGLYCHKILHGSRNPPPFCPHTRLLADGLPHSEEIYEERLGGHFIISVSPLFDKEGKIAGCVHYARDINDRKLAEESVKVLNEELEQMVVERTRLLVDAQEELVRKEKLATLGQLSGSVGHELRNPLGVMSNALYFLNTVMTDADETIKEYLEIIRQEINNCQRIITDLLDFARVKTPQSRVIRARELVDDSLRRCVLPESVRFRADIPENIPAVVADPQQMGQVFENLITNAVQAMPEGGDLRISARSVQSSEFGVQGQEEKNVEPRTSNLELDADFVEISVEDSGEGISPENIKKLFQPLFTTKARGIGLGLTVCRNLTEANGGCIDVESRMGEGTKFTVTLPVERGD